MSRAARKLMERVLTNLRRRCQQTHHHPNDPPKKEEIELNPHRFQERSERPGQIVSPLHTKSHSVSKTPDGGGLGTISGIPPLDKEFSVGIPKIPTESPQRNSKE